MVKHLSGLIPHTLDLEYLHDPYERGTTQCDVYVFRIHISQSIHCPTQAPCVHSPVVDISGESVSELGHQPACVANHPVMNGGLHTHYPYQSPKRVAGGGLSNQTQPHRLHRLSEARTRPVPRRQVRAPPTSPPRPSHRQSARRLRTPSAATNAVSEVPWEQPARNEHLKHKPTWTLPRMDSSLLVSRPGSLS